MAQADRTRLLERALALPHARATDFAGGRVPPSDADPELLRRIDDTTLRTKLVEVGLAEGLQSPKGPQKIASILRIYPGFDAPAKRPSNGKTKSARPAAAPVRSALPSVDEMERLIARIREVEAQVAHDLARETDGQISRLKSALAQAEGDDLERTYRELGDALERKRALDSQVRHEAFKRIEGDGTLPERTYLRLLRR
jgi:hypothetical protein